MVLLHLLSVTDGVFVAVEETVLESVRAQGGSGQGVRTVIWVKCWDWPVRGEGQLCSDPACRVGGTVAGAAQPWRTLLFTTVLCFAADDNIPAKILSYNRANRAVAILCNHQRAPPKTFEKSMMNLQTKVPLPLPSSWIGAGLYMLHLRSHVSFHLG